MEASKLQKKTKLNKGKLKKTLKNVLCRPDPVFWPELNDNHASPIIKNFNDLKIFVPEFVKPKWCEIKNIPKTDRPKAPKIPKVDGVILGISSCLEALSDNQVAGVIIAAEVNPRIMVHHVLETCKTREIPVVCLRGLKEICKECFKISSSCLSVKKDSNNVRELRDNVVSVSKHYLVKSGNKIDSVLDKKIDDKMECEDISNETNKMFTYLIRKSKSERVFVPNKVISVEKKEYFSGQNYVGFDSKTKIVKSNFKNMIVKKVVNNPNRKNKKNKSYLQLFYLKTSFCPRLHPWFFFFLFFKGKSLLIFMR